MTGLRPLNCIVPPHLLHRLLQNNDPAIREAALSTVLTTARLRGEREVRSTLLGATGPAQGRRTVYDCKSRTDLTSALVVRTEDGQASGDTSVNNASDGLGSTRRFYRDVLGRNSIDDRGMRLDGYVHRGRRYNNAFWDGQEMVFGDGDGVVFTDFTGSLDVIGHELTHGVTEYTAGLEYHNESGALNESLSDVLGSLVKQWSRQETADEADWLIGPEIFTPDVDADALRSMKDPGSAYDNETLGKDPQPAHMRDYVDLPDTDEGDNGGVHINSGIPNHAFYLTATAIGGYAWEAAGHIWYESLRASMQTTDFQAFADTTDSKAGELYGPGSSEQMAVRDAWDGVGIKVNTGLRTPARGKKQRAPRGSAGNGTSPELAKQFAKLVAQVEKIRNELHLPA